MAKKPAWQESGGGGATLQTDLLNLYVEPTPGGFLYRVCGQWQLRYSQKPIATLEEAKSKCLTAARKRLFDEINLLDVLISQ